jgi:hypothetical protein
MGNSGGLYSDPIEANGFDDSVMITIPPLSVIMLKPV